MDSIVDKRERANGKNEYRVRWLGYDSDDDTWEPMENIGGCDAIVKLFNKTTHVSFSKNVNERNIISLHAKCLSGIEKAS